ncbi:MAG: hypothetical protein COZ98_03775 [Candidatus Omnitrophica bacterium CG_4_8_14_3_um_filter_43_15]|nr:MAG: hypothetical protein COS29_04195 [Candidatus Omnitrophica bacterium CG02_land_8_20_14_3_00__42_8]PIW80163.1 MAG: hypothetical protein COZ98_03775 [Candidatus Omnitrophica bacterium CG_4_8_14_3_um_filter_43_15]
MKCRVCGFRMHICEVLNKCALEVSRFYKRPLAFKSVKVHLFTCGNCGHYQTEYFNHPDYYDDYFMTVSHSSKLRRLQRRQIEKLADFCENRSNFIEIGCGDGNFLLMAKRFFGRTLGVEPSSVFYDICKNKRLVVVNAYFTKNIRLKRKFSAFACRQVFEHISKPREILSVAYEACKDGAVGLIEVPNAQKTISQNRYFDIFADHINYFTPQSLAALVTKCGFEIIVLSESFGGDYLEVYVRKNKKAHDFGHRREEDVKFILKNISKYKVVSAWGAGAKAQAIIAYAGSRLNIKYIFDSDTNKHGKFLPNCPTKILKPASAKIVGNDLIIIFAVSYQDEIIGLLKRMNYKGDILCIDGLYAKVVNIKNTCSIQ